MRKKIQYGFAVFSALMLVVSVITAVRAGKTASVSGSLIQTVTEKDVCMGMIHLGLLETKTYEEGNLAEAMETVRPSVVKIQMAGYYGSGTIYRITEEEIILVSNKHLLSLDDTCQVTFYTEDVAEGTVFGISKQYDIGFVSVPLASLSYDAVMKLRYSAVDRQCCESLQKGDEMFVAGSADSVAASIYSGEIAHTDWYVEEFDANMIYSYCYGEAGMSGGGTYDAHGHYIGMLTGGCGEEIASLPVAVITEAYEECRKEGK